MARSGGRSGAYGGDSGSELACRGPARGTCLAHLPLIHHALAPAYSRLMARPRRVLSYGKRHGNLRFDAVDSSILVFVQAVSDIFANFADYLYKSGCALD